MAHRRWERSNSRGIPCARRHVIARMAVVLTGGCLLVFASGCCTAMLHGSVSEPEEFQGFSNAYRDDDALFVAYTTQREQNEATVERHAVLRPGRAAKLHRGRISGTPVLHPRPLVAAESRDAALAHPDKTAILWWQPDRYDPSYHFLWDAQGEPIESQLRIDHWYVPHKKYATMIVFAPVTIALDVVTLPVQALVFVVVWSVDWTAPYK
jgi:hypothetical protein